MQVGRFSSFGKERRKINDCKNAFSLNPSFDYKVTSLTRVEGIGSFIFLAVVHMESLVFDV